MRHSEYERRRRALEKQLHDDVALIRAGYQAKLRALEMLWLGSPEADEVAEVQAPGETQTGGETLASGGTQSGTQERDETQENIRMAVRGGLVTLVREALPRLPEVFDKDDLAEALGFEPRRSTLSRAIDQLLFDEQIKIEQHSGGRRMTRYRKAAPPA
ncbi:MAG TPA: hypothetical protein VGG03_20275 [Thermoanaerobaculia bacterium]|jgi:hypothetical protein